MNRKILNLVIAISVFYSYSMFSIAEDKSMEEMVSAAINMAANEGQTRIDIVLGETPGIVEQGDLVTVRYSLKEVGDSTALKSYPETIAILAGQHDQVPQMHNAVTGLKVGESRHLTLSQEEAFGPVRSDRLMTMSSRKSVDKNISIPIKNYREQFGYEPEKGNKVRLVPYFTHTITGIDKNEVKLEADVAVQFETDDSLGKAIISPEEEKINIMLAPKLGASFQMGDEIGKIVSADKESFTVDFNHPLAGKGLVLDVSVVSFIKASGIEDLKISWNEDYQKGSETAQKEEKPVLLLFYKDGCPWCEKLFDETMEDPRVTYLGKEFVWVKTNGEKAPELMDSYGMDLYPSILFLNSKGEVVEKMAGYQSAPVLRDWLNSALNKINKAPVNVSDAKTIIQDLP